MAKKKKDVIAQARLFFERLESKKETKGHYKWEDILNNINNPEKFAMYQKALDKKIEIQKQEAIFDKLIAKNPKFKDVNAGPFERCLTFYLKTDGSKESEKYNIDILEKYRSGSGKAEMVKEALMRLYGLNLKDMANALTSERNIVDYYYDNRLLIEQGFLAEAIIKCPELNIPEEVKQYHAYNKTFFEAFSGFSSYGKFMNTEMFFFFDDITKFNDLAEAANIQEILTGSKIKFERNEVNGICNFTFLKGDFNNLIEKVNNNQDVDFNKPMYEIKVVNKENFNEAPYNEIFNNEKSMFMEKSEAEIASLKLDDIRPNIEYIATKESKKLLDLAVTHNNKSRPGFFSWLFNTKYNQTYVNEAKEINILKANLCAIGVSEYTVNLISRLTAKQDGACAGAIEEAKEFEAKQYGAKEEPVEVEHKSDREPIIVEEVNNKEIQKVDIKDLIDNPEKELEDEDEKFDEEEYELNKEI